ncbi:MAG: energy-coupling factor transporter ATPase [Bulleidia sp.]|nr:energy-coupling factor transporter ATPase [Erysipelotrichaceae bacterium]MDY2780351.1 energy-coupling factor transporter ATPase [Bulleidia sp.]
MGIIDVDKLTFSYDEKTDAVHEVSFSIEKGQYCTIVGHNGSGKSTVAKLLTGLLEKKSGSIVIDGLELNIENLRKIRNKIGIVFQNPDNQFIGSTVRDDIAFGLENHCVEQVEMDPIIEEFSNRVGMHDYLNSEPTRLSGGQKQRVAIAGVLAMHPDIIIFDEATSMLDPQGKDEIKKVIMDLHKERNLTILSITHDIDEVTTSDYVLVMDEGQIILKGTPEEVFKKEDKLKETQFDLPYSMKLAKELDKLGVHIKDRMTMEGMVDELCQLHLKK